MLLNAVSYYVGDHPSRTPVLKCEEGYIRNYSVSPLRGAISIGNI